MKYSCVRIRGLARVLVHIELYTSHSCILFYSVPYGKSTLRVCVPPLQIVYYIWDLFILCSIRNNIITCKYPILSKKMFARTTIVMKFEPMFESTIMNRDRKSKSNHFTKNRNHLSITKKAFDFRKTIIFAETQYNQRKINQ